MHFLATASFFLLPLLSAVSATPSFQRAQPEVRGLEERQIDLPISVDLGTINLGIRALVGDPVCPPIASDGITAQVFASVQLGEQIDLDASIPASLLGLVGLNVQATATAVANANICLCVRAGIDVGLIDLPIGLNAQVLADLQAAASANVDLGAVAALLSLAPAVDVSLTPISKIDCTCPAINQFPTCVDGTCGCGTCPAGQIYNTSTGQCVPTPSGLARRRAIGYGRESHLKQAKRAEIVERLQQRA